MKPLELLPSFDDAVLLKCIDDFEGQDRAYYKHILTEHNFLLPETTNFLIDKLRYVKLVEIDGNKISLTSKGKEHLRVFIKYYKTKAGYLFDENPR